MSLFFLALKYMDLSAYCLKWCWKI